MTTNRASGPTAGVIFESEYGRFQRPYWWLFGLVGLIGVVGVPVGIFFNKGWRLGVQPLEPWSATLIIEIFAVSALLTFAYVVLAHLYLRTSPQRVALTRSALIIPKGSFTREELSLPLVEIDTKVFNVGFVKQLQIKHGRRKILLVSAKFPSNEQFERLVSVLAK
jgi:hypothetical protein